MSDGPIVKPRIFSKPSCWANAWLWCVWLPGEDNSVPDNFLEYATALRRVALWYEWRAVRLNPRRSVIYPYVIWPPRVPTPPAAPEE